MEVSIFKRLRIALIPDALDRTRYIVKHRLFAQVGKNFFFQPRIMQINAEYIKIHDNVAVASGVTFINHDVIQKVFNNLNEEIQISKKYGCIEIMDNVFIGSNATILYDVKIGPNAIVAAGSMVVEDVPPGTIVGGVPAQVIGSFDELYRKRIMESEGITEEIYPVDLCWERFDEKHKSKTKEPGDLK